MAARTQKIRLSSEWRDRIKLGELLARVEGHALGQNDMTATQLRAAEICLRKALPDLTSMDMSVTNADKPVAELADSDLQRIAAAGSAGTVKAQERPQKPTGVH